MMTDSSPLPSVPYRGIEPYRFVDHRIFFARQAETLELLRSVAIFKGVLLFGGSGNGKSSLINAGLIPATIDMGFAPDRIRIQNQLNGEITVERISLNDDDRSPFLSPSLADAAGDSGSPRVVFSLEQFKERLHAYASQQRALLIFDQFEEIITLFEETPSAHGTLKNALDSQKKIIDVLVDLLHDDSLHIKMLFSFREDYLAKLTKLFLLAPELPNQYLRLILPQKSTLNAIISGPLNDVELREHFSQSQTFSDELIERLISEFTLRNEGDAVSLSEVQIVCLELWNAPDPDELFELRGVQGLLEDYLTKELSEFSDAQRSLAIGLLSHMLTASNTRNIISGVDLIRLFRSEEDVAEEQLKETLRSLTKTRLVRRELRYSEYFYEITSEFLVPWIIQRKAERQSNLERRKLAEETRKELDRERERASQELKFEQERASQQLEYEQKLAQKKIFYLRWAVILLGFVVALFLAFAYIANQQHRRQLQLQADADRSRQKLEAQQNLNATILNILTQLFRSAPPQATLDKARLADIKNELASDKLGAIQHISSLIKKNQFPPEMVPSLISPALTPGSPDSEVARAARDLLTEATEAKGKLDALKDEMTKDKLDALHQMSALVKEKKFPPDLVLALLTPTLAASDSNSDVAKAVRDLLGEAAAANHDLKTSIVSAVANDPALAARVPARIYVQIESEKQLDQANSIKTELEKNGYIVPGIEIVDIRAPLISQLRYYREQDLGKVNEIVTLLKNSHFDVTPVYFKGYENSTKVRPGHYELWFAAQLNRGEAQWYVIVSYSRATDEQREQLQNLISQMTQEGAAVKYLSAHELSIGPYSKEEAQSAKQRLLTENLARKVVILKR